MLLLPSLDEGLVSEIKNLMGGKETIIKARPFGSDRNEFVGTAAQYVDYRMQKEGVKVVQK